MIDSNLDPDNRFISPEKNSDDDREVGLRPKALMEFVGQEAIKQNLSIFIEAAKSRNESIEHLLFYGPPGLGKTTLANIIAKEMGVNIKIT